MRIKTDFPNATIEIPNMSIVLPDGCRLSARVLLPKDGGANATYPAILEFSPYRKRDGTVVHDAPTHPYFAGHINLSLRGNLTQTFYQQVVY